VYSKCAFFMVTIAESDPDMDILRADPRFDRMLNGARERLAKKPSAIRPAATSEPPRS
jgi:hypothetical protein